MGVHDDDFDTFFEDMMGLMRWLVVLGAVVGLSVISSVVYVIVQFA